MSAVAICPNCHVANNPSNANCEICKTSLGAVIIDSELGVKWVVISGAVTLGLYVPCWLFGFHPVTLLMASFYGPLAAAYYARTNVVWPAALGGLAASSVLIVIQMLLRWKATKLAIVSIVRAPGFDSTIALGFGVPLVLLAFFPLSLVGASVGEHLSVRRRRKR